MIKSHIGKEQSANLIYKYNLRSYVKWDLCNTFL